MLLALTIVLSMSTVAFAAEVLVSDENELNNAITNAVDGTVIKLENDIELFTPRHNTNGLNYEGAANFTIDLNGKTISVKDGSTITNSLFRIVGSPTITLKNGTIDGEDKVYHLVRANGSSTVNLEDIVLTVSKNASVAVANLSSDATVNIKSGTEITVTDAYAGVEASGTVNIYEGAAVAYYGSSFGSGLGSVVGTSGGEVNIYGGSIFSDEGAAVSTNTSGGTINIYGGPIVGATSVMAYTDSYYNELAVTNIYRWFARWRPGSQRYRRC